MTAYRYILCFILLLTVCISSVAEDSIRVRSCRRGTPRPQGMLLHRGAPGGQPRLVGGDFYHGNCHQLTVLVAFNDRAFTGDEAATIQQWDKIFNAENLQEDPFKGSVHDYFYAQSYGNFNIIFDLQYVKVSGNAAKYASNDVDDENSQFLVADIMEELKTRNIDWSLYDWNGDGFVNQLLIVYAGHGMNDSYGPDLIWPHQWWMSEHMKDQEAEIYCDPIPVDDGSKQFFVDCYCALAELTKKNDYGSFGTICHEYSHCFGFPDFYYGSGTKVVAGWDLMDNGNYNGGGYCPAGYSAHERWLMGWLTPTELTETATVTGMPQLAEQPVAYLVRNDAYEDEYYFIENRQQTGWDTSLPGHGVVVFHIDFDVSVWPSTQVSPNSSSYKRYSIFPANNKPSVYLNEGWPYPNGENNSLTNDSEPAATVYHANADGEKLMSKPITDIRVDDGLASFEFMADGPTSVSLASRPSTSSLSWYALDGRRVQTPQPGHVYIVRGEDGNMKKLVFK